MIYYGYNIKKGKEMELTKCKNGRFVGYWEVKHYWDDGVTIQCRYFKSLKEALNYMNVK
jgi:hypothetical protein